MNRSFLIGGFFLSMAAHGQAFKATVAALVEASCIDCHDAETPKADFNLAELSRDLNEGKSLSTWVRLFDRVEKLMHQAIAQHPPFIPGCHLLFQSLQLSKQWQQGIDTYAHLSTTQQQELRPTLVQFLCERYLQTNDLSLLNQALAQDPHCSRARHLRLPHMVSPLMDVDFILHQDIDYFPKLLPFLEKHVEPNNLRQYQTWLKQATHRQHHPQVLLAASLHVGLVGPGLAAAVAVIAA